MKRLDVYEWVADFVLDNDLPDGEEILVELDGRDICRAVVQRENDESIGYESIDFKVKALR